MLRLLPFALLLALCLSCGATMHYGPTLTPFPTLTPEATPTATPRPTATPEPYDGDCAGVREAATYADYTEYRWFHANCLVEPLVWIGFGHLPGLGSRLMELYTIDASLCPSGFVATTVEHEPNSEAFSYAFRSFCFRTIQANLSRVPQPFECQPGDVAIAEEVVLPFLSGFTVTDVEVFCVEAMPAEPN